MTTREETTPDRPLKGAWGITSLLFLFMLPEFSRPFWSVVDGIANAAGVSSMEIAYGWHLFHFWR